MGASSTDVAALFDFHIHSQYSEDGRGTLQELASAARTKGLQGFAVTDHNSLRMAKDMKAFRRKDLLLVPGMEVSTRVGHCLALGIREPVPIHLSLEETIEKIEDAGGVGVPSHPYRLVHGVGEGELDHALESLRAIEVFNARNNTRTSNELPAAYALNHAIGGTGGSDAHQVFEIGNAYTTFPDAPAKVDDVVRMIEKGKTWGGGARTPRLQLLRQNAKNTLLFVRRGFRSI